MPTNVENLAKKAQAQLAAHTTHHLKERLEWLQPYPVGLRLKSLLAIQKEDWTALERLAAHYRRDALKDLLAIRKQQSVSVQLGLDIDRVSDAARKKDNWIRPKKRPDWAQLRIKVIRKLRKKGLNMAQAQQGVKAFAIITLDDMIKVAKNPLELWTRHLETGAIPRLSTLAAADIADAVAQFNQRYKRGGRLPAPKPNSIRKANVDMKARLNELRMVLRNKGPNAIAVKARGIHLKAKRALAPLINAAAYIARSDAAGGTVSSGRDALRVADVLRLTFFTLAAARVVEWKAGWLDGERLSEWRGAAKSKALKSAYRAPAATDLSDVARAPEEFDGKFISLEGRVGPVSIMHRGEKVISSTSLSDANGAVVSVGITHIKLDSGGLVPGSYAHVTGTFKTRTAEFPAPVLVLDRRNLTDDSRTSWLDWLSLQMLAVLEVETNGICGAGSWRPGVDGPGNVLRYGTWANNRRRVF